MEALRHKEERISIRLDAYQKSVIDAAAEALGISLSSFVLSHVLEAASKVVERQRQIQLSETPGNSWSRLIAVDIDRHLGLKAAERYRGSDLVRAQPATSKSSTIITIGMRLIAGEESLNKYLKQRASQDMKRQLGITLCRFSR